MASSPAAARLSTRHRAVQRRIGERAHATFRPIWEGLDAETVLRSWPAVESSAIGIITEHRQLSARRAASYYQSFRMMEGFDGDIDAPLAVMTPSVADRARTSLRVVGPLKIARDLNLRRAESETLGNALVRVLGVLDYHVLNGGRDTIRRAVRRDRNALGYARVTSGKPCHFCAMLASRGPVYSERGRFAAHPACACSLEPVYSRDTVWPGRGREFRELYDSTAKGQPDAALAFRRAYEGRTA